METKYETKYSDEYNSAVLDTAADAPLKSSYVKRRLSLFSDDPSIRRLQASVRQECLQMNKELMRQKKEMLSIK